MCVTLYTSRIILDELGTSDYGIYNLVAGVVAMLGFLNASMTAATQRYLSFDIGKSDIERLKKTFSAVLSIHFFLALFCLLIAETIGLWYINNKMVYPIDRTYAVNMVYQFSVITFLMGIIQVPYNSLIIAREKMNIFAYVSIIEALFKLGAVYLLMTLNKDKLIVYSILTFLVAFIVRVIYQIYCRRHFNESKFRFEYDKKYYSELLSYSGWSLFGNMAAVLRSQGSNVILNLFFGTVINAAYGITLQVLSAVNMFVSNFQLALNPQIIQNYASNNRDRAINLMMQGSKFSFFLILMLIVPIIINTEYVLHIWLKEVPENTAEFIQLCLIGILIDSISGSLMTMITAIGKIKLYQLILGSMNIFILPISYMFLNAGYDGEIIFKISIIFSILSLIIRLMFLCFLLELDLKLFFTTVLARIFSVMSVVVALLNLVNNTYYQVMEGDEVFKSLFKISGVIIAVVILVIVLGTNGRERSFLRNKIQTIVS
ncbi:lipopolysaccharide biosynthesis protein [Echinicola strongylocentroti]|uniref:Lipopolysaccharide biosynthesis protein n=1 Tax=Echinicola strongylocentroti TaxID=1795355 RepID=A0A2Z4IN09_9BACT|nr:lipopolysaccharide biosynthesis protein [Echinicola strongylocentroti]